MLKSICAVACLLLTAQVVAPPEPSEADKKKALLLGYWINGDSMVRAPHLGSIDVSGLLKVFQDATLADPPLNKSDKLNTPDKPQE